MNATELRKKTKDELGTVLIDLSREKFNLKMQKGTGQLVKPDQVKKVRRDIARVHTIINEMART
ncbi:MAG: 50S ribosomal protein L29 [Methyloglobulus sp.]|jgi:large subunit ribosomal protein L29|nr:50S ribosomal protein L29 [Pseudomonadota bacterium]MSS75492.1 50S ribosomal protein L29 [Methyloglobulus sp.]